MHRARSLPLLLVVFTPACKPLLYPVARAFGSPAEGELKLRRAAFERLKAQRATARILVHPLVDPIGRRQQPPPVTSELAAKLLREGGWTGAVAAPATPEVAPIPLGRNQLRFVQDRARAYGAWAKATKPEADFLVVVEVLSSAPGRVHGIHGYVLEASGQVVLVHLQNSHHFGTEPPKDAEQACRWMVRLLLRDLERPALEIHPRWGIG